VKDLIDKHVAAEKIAAKWVIGFVKSRLNDAENASLFEANGVQEISDNSLILPINVSYGSGYIMINSEDSPCQYSKRCQTPPIHSVCRVW
jgi:hypothetical protein